MGTAQRHSLHLAAYVRQVTFYDFKPLPGRRITFDQVDKFTAVDGRYVHAAFCQQTLVYTALHGKFCSKHRDSFCTALFHRVCRRRNNVKQRRIRLPEFVTCTNACRIAGKHRSAGNMLKHVDNFHHTVFYAFRAFLAIRAVRLVGKVNKIAVRH